MNYMIVVHYKLTDTIENRYFKTEEEMNEFIKKEIRAVKTIKLLHKFEIKEV